VRPPSTITRSSRCSDTARARTSRSTSTDALEVASALAMVDARSVLVDDRSVVELLRDVVGRRPDQLDAPLARAPVRVGPGKRRQKRVVDVDRRHIDALQEVAAQWEETMFAARSNRKPDTAATMPGRSAQPMSRRAV
jgi:hypothetical protein